MTEEQKAKFQELALAYRCTITLAGLTATLDAIEAYVSQLVADAYQAGRADERNAVRLWGVK